MALIEIDDFPSYKPPFILGIFHGYVSHNQMLLALHSPSSIIAKERSSMLIIMGKSTISTGPFSIANC
jgi:hypothetical protein